MEMVLVRHAEPAWLGPGGAVNDPGLTPLGAEQAQALARHLAAALRRDAGPVWLWCSPARRARETAAPLCAELGLEAEARAWLAETETPDFTGMSAPSLAEVWRDARRRDLAAWWGGFPDAEDLRTFSARVASGVDAGLATLGASREAGAEAGLWRALPRDGRLVVVSHAGTTGALVGHLLGLPPVPWPWERFPTGHASITRLRTTGIAGGAIFALHTLGSRGHLPSEAHTR
ncbi:MAG: histidine phosphatase family protein [Deltaproteobacteria bacterium]|nr:histidine phosphatase family protein [Deltaproteobacteria bacterium]MCB9786086.1 histidine phosphatase family protein [Deltaproteobacteria bacterium]